MILRSIWHGGIVIAFIAALSFSTIFLITVQADGPPPGVDTAKRGDVVEEVFEKEPDEETPDSTLPPGVDTAKRGEVVEEDVEKERDKEATDPTLPPGVDAAQRGDVVKEEGNTVVPRLTAPAPQNLSVDDYDEESVDLSWDSVTNAYGYKVEYKASNSSTWLHGSFAGSSTSDTIDDLECDTTYDFRVRARGNGGVYSWTYGAASSTVSQETSLCVLPAPEDLSVDDYDHESVSLSWDAVTGADAYKLEYRESSSSTWLHGKYIYSGESTTLDDLDCETTYYFRVRVRGNGVSYSLTYSLPSSSVSRETSQCRAPAPENLSVDDYDVDDVDLSWDSVTNAYGYKLEYRVYGSSTWLHGTFAGSSTSDTIDDLACGTTYYFRVRARGNGGTYSWTYGDPSSSVSQKTSPCVLSPPENLSVDDYDDVSVDLSWDAVTGAVNYKLEYRASGSSTWYHGSFAGSSTSDTLDDLPCTTKYYFRVRARGNGVSYSATYSLPSSSVSRACDAPSPDNLSVTDYDEESVSLSWDAVTDAPYVKVEYKESNSSTWLHGGYVSFGTSYTIDDLECDTTYDFRVRARGDGDPYSSTYGDPSSSVERETSLCVLPAPENLSVDDYDDDSVDLSWDAVTGAVEYQVLYRASGTSTWYHGSYSGSTSDTIDDLACTTKYYFRVRARGNGVSYSVTYGDLSSSVSRACDAPPPENLSAMDYDGDSVTLSWDAVTDAPYVKVEYKESNSNTWLQGGYVSFGTSYTMDDLECDTTYDFRVRARGDGDPYSYTYGDPSSIVSQEILCVLPAPENLSVTGYDHESVSLSWDAVTGADAYNLEYRESSTTTWLEGKYVYSGVSTTLDDLDCETTYDFRVRVRGNGVSYSLTYSLPSSIESQETSQCRAPPPENVSVTDYDHESVTLGWDEVTDAPYFKVEYRESSTSGWLHGGYVSFGTSYTIGDLECETTYDFRVRARGDGDPYSSAYYGDPSLIVSQETSLCVLPAPENLSVDDYDEESVTLAWDALTGAAAYKVEYKASSSSTWLHGSYAGSATSDTIDDLECGTTYDFRVRARGNGVSYSITYSDPSLIVSQEILCVLAAPENLSVTGYDNESVSLSWDTVTGADAYKVEYKENSSTDWLHGKFIYSGESTTLDDLECETTYDFRVRVRGNGVSYSLTYSLPSSIESQETSQCRAPPPENVSVTDYDHESVTLGWDEVTDAPYFKVEYRESSTSGWLHGGYVSFGTSYTIDDLECETTYDFRVRARGDGDPYSSAYYGDPSASVEQETSLCVLPAPENLSVDDYDDESVDLSWDEVTGAAEYKVEYRASGSSTWIHDQYVVAGTGETATTTVEDLACTSKYYFRVRARGDGDPYSSSYGDPSKSVSRTCTAPPPENLSVDDYDDESVDLSWDAVTGAAEYKVEYRASGSSTWIHDQFVSSGRSVIVDDLECDTAYYFRVSTRGDGDPYSSTYGDPSASVLHECTDAVLVGIDIDNPNPVAGQTVTMTAVTDDSSGDAVSYQWQELGSESWIDVGPATATKMVTFDVATTKIYRVVATYGIKDSVISHFVEIEWRVLAVSIEADPAYPSSGDDVTLTAVTDAPQGVTLSHRWQEKSSGTWSDLTSTSSEQIVNLVTRGSREFKVIVTYGAAEPVETPSAFVTWDEQATVVDLVEDLVISVAMDKAYGDAEFVFLTCVNDGTPYVSHYESFDQVMANYTETEDRVSECEDLVEDPNNNMFGTISTLSEQKLNDLKNSNSIYASLLLTPRGREFEQAVGDPSSTGLKLNAKLLAGVIAADEEAAPDEESPPLTKGGGNSDRGFGDKNEVDHGFESCFDLNSGETEIEKFQVLNCLLFVKPHSLWVDLHHSSKKQDALKEDLNDYWWLGYGDWECSDWILFFPPGEGLPCLKHDVAYASLQQIMPSDGGNPDNKLDSAWNPRNKFLADLMLLVDGICAMKVDEERRQCVSDNAQDRSFFQTLWKVGWWIPNVYRFGVSVFNSKSWPITEQDAAHVRENLEYLQCDVPRPGSVPTISHDSDRRFDITWGPPLAMGCVEDITAKAYYFCFNVTYSGWRTKLPLFGAGEQQPCYWLTEPGKFDVPNVSGASWSSLRLVSVEIEPNDVINWEPEDIFDWVPDPIFDWVPRPKSDRRYLYPKNWYSIIVNADD